ncbi:hypothetical protein E6H21_10535 [Candidatus Bathyarchaeota archaeon]|nr:MAG: hypothetical protein AUF78_14795 [archaeon 13_1_20CM_2_51_12]TMI39009.1 MAG: hypothetical protein E6H21_10535 [Candidatus Bathyarchaeota archaeon]
MVVESRIPPGASLLLMGSGLYWILSSELISSFTVLTPGQFQTDALGTLFITVVGIICTAVGLWIVHVDFDELRNLFSRRDGWIFTVPVGLAAADVYLTLIVLSTSSQIVELNPFVSSAIGIGAAALVPFIVSYLALSQGLGLFMLRIGSYLFGPLKSYRYLPFVSICGAAAFGPTSNLALLIYPTAGLVAYLMGALGCVMLPMFLFTKIKKP